MVDQVDVRNTQKDCAGVPRSGLLRTGSASIAQGFDRIPREETTRGPPRSAPGQNSVKCRRIEENDIAPIIALLTRGFPDRDIAYWRRGLQRQAQADVPPGYPRYGYLIESRGEPVGTALLLCFRAELGDGPGVRCNISSWYVEPAFRCYASMLVAATTPIRAGTTYVNISPAPSTWPIVEAQGFTCHSKGQFFAIPSLNSLEAQTSFDHVTSGAMIPPFNLPASEQRLLFSHMNYGCVCLCVGDVEGTPHPFVFLPFRLRVGFVYLRSMHLVYCRDVSEFVRFSGNLGRFLLRFGVLFVAVDANGPINELRGIYRAKARMYFKGPDAPRLGDLAYTERVLFGP